MSKVFNMVGGGGGPAASIFVTGLSETDTVTATKGSNTLTGQWTQKPNPLAHGLPDGYTELEYIESTGTQYIDTGLVTSSNQYKIETNLLWKKSDGFFGANNGYWFGITSDLHFEIAGNVKSSSTASLNQKYNIVHEVDSTKTTNNYSFKVDGVNVLSGSFSNFQNGKIFALFAIGQSTSGVVNYASAKCYSESIWINDVLVREFIPAKRNSDSVIGMYDLVNDVFYTNAGTGEFIAGSEIPQTFDGHMLSPIRDFGTWTVTATNVEQTATQDVLVDVITEYEIEMYYKPVGALYWRGDECEDVTGGWTNSGYTNNSVTMQGGEKRSKSLYFANTGTDNYVGFGTVNTVNLNSINGIKVEVVSGSFGGYDALLLTKSKTNYATSANEVKELRLTDTGTFALDVSEIITSVYIMLRCGSGTTLEIGKVWLE